MVTSFKPLEAFLYRKGFARLSLSNYSLDSSDLENRFIHLTNSSLQKYHDDLERAENVSHDEGSKITLDKLKMQLKEQGVDFEPIWENIRELIVKSLYVANHNISNCENSFELFGYDIIIDSKLKPWLIEVNNEFFKR